MARMIPDIDPSTIPNAAERTVYAALRRLPAGYVALYSYKFMTEALSLAEGLAELKDGEADFVVAHPRLGYAVLEVKQGDIAFFNGIWQEWKGTVTSPLHKDPVEQAKRAMYAILHRWQGEAKTKYFPLKAAYAVAFPECTRVGGITPAHVNAESVLCIEDIEQLEQKVSVLLGGFRETQTEAFNILLDKVLAPRFRVFARLEDKMDMFHRTSERILTDEQQRILEETELDKRKVFFGAAGTGKTFIAMEKAKRLHMQGKHVFLTCFNKSLCAYFRQHMPVGVTCGNFLDYALEAVRSVDPTLQEPESNAEKQHFYDNTLPERAFDFFAEIPEAQRFDAIVVDEGQDLKELCYTCLNAMVKSDGEFYVFADLNQDLFGGALAALRNIAFSKHRLTRNLRNGEPITNWLARFVKDGTLKPGVVGGMPPVFKPCRTAKEERSLIEHEIGSLVSQGVKPSRIAILSPNRLKNSCLAGCTKIKDWSLVEDSRARGGIRFATIRSFKGLEADIVFLIGVRSGNEKLTEADLYVGASRARFLLYIFYDENDLPKRLLS